MTAGFVAAGVRGRGLARRCLGAEGARQLAASPSLPDALATLATTAYGREVRQTMSLADAQHAVSGTVLWHLRVLAGWVPPLGAEPLRLLAAGFEAANVTGHLARLTGRRAPAPYDLGSMASIWSRVSAARTPGEVRAALRSSPWGDPGSDELPAVRLALRLAWARRVLDGAPGAGDWAIAGAALVVARVLAAGARPALQGRAGEDADHLLGPQWRAAASPAELAAHVPRTAARTLRGVAGRDDLWRAEVAWWRTVGSEGAALAVRPRPDASAGVGVVAMMAADAWRVRGALAMAAAGQGAAWEGLGAVA